MKNPIVVFAIIVGVLFMLSLAAAAPPPAQDHYMNEMDQLELDALDQSFRQHMQNLFMVYMREPYPDVDRPLAGAEKLRGFYSAIRTEIDKREAERNR